jgi:two-component system response regulator DesR
MTTARMGRALGERPALAVALATTSARTAERLGELLRGEGLDATVHGEDLLDPDVIVLARGAEVGVDRIRTLRRDEPQAPIVVVLPARRSTEMRSLLEAGAAAVLLDDAPDERLALAIRAVLSGLMVVPQELRRSMSPPSLSHRERQVLGLVAAGLTNEQIARRLFLAESTVKGYLTTAFQRLGVRSRREATSIILGADDVLRRRLTAPAAPPGTSTPQAPQAPQSARASAWPT